MKLMEIEQGLSLAYHPQMDGQTEHTNTILEQFLCTYKKLWTDLLTFAEYSYNNLVHNHGVDIV